MKTLNIGFVWGKNSFGHSLWVMMAASLLNPLSAQPVEAQAQSCQLSSEAIAQTRTFRQVALQGEDDVEVQKEYQDWQRQLATQLRDCRRQTWPQTQAIWLRLYPCDVRPGGLDEIFDRILSRGYNQVYLEVFSDGQVLLPSADNRTAWSSVVWQKGYENRDLLAEAIAKGRARGIKVYSWMFALNFGYTYSLRPGSDQVLARNGQGQTSLSFGSVDVATTGTVGSNETFVDPYNPQAQRDYYDLVQAILKRQPDGVLFDYVRYPRGVGSATIASKVKDLWVYGTASQEALIQRGQNERGRELIRRYLTQGNISAADVSATRAQHPQDKEPFWQGRTATSSTALNADLWRLSINHALQGVLNFLAMATLPVQQRGLPAGAVFFPQGNQAIGEGYDARLQPWDQFPSAIEWHPMAYSTCGDMSCIVAEIQRVTEKAPAGTQVIPALAGTWGGWYNEHPPLEWQMQTVQRTMPQINAVSHFAFSWQDAGYERDRKTCRLQ
jgi:Glycosyl hydrolase-like 10